MRKNIQKVTTAFLLGVKLGNKQTDSCSTDGRIIYSYQTPIAKRNDKLTEVNLVTTKFSITTTKQQNTIRFIIEHDTTIKINSVTAIPQ